MLRSITMRIYVDEQHQILDKDTEERYMAIAALFVSEDEYKQTVNDLLRLRCLKEDHDGWHWDYANCPSSDSCKEVWHKLNNKELHFQTLHQTSSHPAKEISRKWLRYALERNKHNKAIRFNILYVNLTNLDIQKFGTFGWHENAYNRFFRTNLKYALKMFFLNNGFNKVGVSKVVHDNSTGLAIHKYFPENNLRKLEIEIKNEIKNGRDKDLEIHPKRIQFLDSDHKKASDSEDRYDCQFLQLVDLILGAATQNIFYTSNDKFKKELAWILRDLIGRLITNPDNPHSSFHYHRKQNISFFPSKKLEKAEQIFIDLNDSVRIEKDKDLFYRVEKLKLPPSSHPDQITLERWLK